MATGSSYVGGGKVLPNLKMKTGSATGMRAVECASCGSSFRTDRFDNKMMTSSNECYDALNVVYSKGFNFTMDHRKVSVQSTKCGSILVSRVKMPAHGAMVGFMRSYIGFGVATAFISTEKDHSAKLCRKCLPHAITLDGAWTQKLSLVEFTRIPMCPPESNGLLQVYLHIITGQGCITSEEADKDIFTAENAVKVAKTEFLAAENAVKVATTEFVVAKTVLDNTANSTFEDTRKAELAYSKAKATLKQATNAVGLVEKDFNQHKVALKKVKEHKFKVIFILSTV